MKFGTRPKRLDSLTTAPEYPYSPGRAYLWYEVHLWYKVPRLYPVEFYTHPITFAVRQILLRLLDNFNAYNAKGT